MSDFKKEKSYFVSKTAIGGLFKALAMDTDPAHTLYFTSALINSCRAALIQKLEDRVENGNLLPSIMASILKIMNSEWNPHGLTPHGVNEINRRLDLVFPKNNPVMMQYGTQIYRDIMYCDDLILRWSGANEIYLSDKDAWAMSNGQLVLIHKVLFEIIFRHELMQLPKGESFNLDHGTTDVSQIINALAAANKESAAASERGAF